MRVLVITLPNDEPNIGGGTWYEVTDDHQAKIISIMIGEVNVPQTPTDSEDSSDT